MTQTICYETSSSGQRACPDTARALYHLEAWAQWMRGWKEKSLQLNSYSRDGAVTLASADFDELVGGVDMHAASVCDTVIGDLPRHQFQAIHRRYLRTAYTCDEPYEQALADAVVAVGRGIYRRGVV